MEQTVLNYDAWRFWLELLLALAAFSATVFGWWVTRTRATSKSIEAINAKVSEVSSSLTMEIHLLRSDIDKLETKVESMPNHKDLGELYNRLSTMDGRLSELIGGVSAMSRGLDNMNTYLLNKDRT